MKIFKLNQSREEYFNTQIIRSNIKFRYCKVSIKHVLKWRNILEKKKNFILDLFGKSTLIEIFNIMKHCNLFIGNDSGLMHMAALANIKTFGLFGPSDKFKYKPWGKGNIVISSTKTPHELMGYEGFDSKKCGSLMMDIKTQKDFENVMKNLVKNK